MPIPASRREIARRIDHALLSPATVARDLDAGCRLARSEGVASVCVRPSDLRKCAEALAGSRTAAGTVIGFPHGGSTRAVKVHEAREAIDDAQSVLGSNGPPVELGLVVNVGGVLSGDWGAVRDEVNAVLDATHARGGLLAVIFETGHLAAEHVRRLCELCGELKVDFVAAATGFGPRAASVADIRLIRDHMPAGIGIKAVGADTLADGQTLLDAGADRIGTHRTAELLADCGDRR